MFVVTRQNEGDRGFWDTAHQVVGIAVTLEAALELVNRDLNDLNAEWTDGQTLVAQRDEHDELGPLYRTSAETDDEYYGDARDYWQISQQTAEGGWRKV